MQYLVHCVSVVTRNVFNSCSFKQYGTLTSTGRSVKELETAMSPVLRVARLKLAD